MKTLIHFGTEQLRKSHDSYTRKQLMANRNDKSNTERLHQIKMI